MNHSSFYFYLLFVGFSFLFYFFFVLRSSQNCFRFSENFCRLMLGQFFCSNVFRYVRIFSACCIFIYFFFFRCSLPLLCSRTITTLCACTLSQMNRIVAKQQLGQPASQLKWHAVIQITIIIIYVAICKCRIFFYVNASSIKHFLFRRYT